MHKLRNAPGETEEDLKAALEAVVGQGRVYVLGLGNTDRADDGAGVLVAQALMKTFPTYSFSEHEGAEGTVLDISEKNEQVAVLFIDAADLHESPGTIRVVRREDIRETEITTHRVAVALMASLLEKTGKRSAVICIQPKTIEFRGQVSKEVRSAVRRLETTLRELMNVRNAK
jgi:hydrogenase 3 maturation protease